MCSNRKNGDLTRARIQIPASNAVEPASKHIMGEPKEICGEKKVVEPLPAV